MAKSSLTHSLARLAVALSIAGAAHAQVASPNALRGISLGAEIAAAFKPCPERAPKFRGDQPSPTQMDRVEADAVGVCYGKEPSADAWFIDSDAVVVNMAWAPGLGRNAGVNLIDGKIERVTLNFASENYELMRASMIEKYGAPVLEERKPIRAGIASSGGKVASWSVGRDLLQLHERWPSRHELGAIILSSRVYLQSLTVERLETQRSIKSAL